MALTSGTGPSHGQDSLLACGSGNTTEALLDDHDCPVAGNEQATRPSLSETAQTCPSMQDAPSESLGAWSSLKEPTADSLPIKESLTSTRRSVHFEDPQRPSVELDGQAHVTC